MTARRLHRHKRLLDILKPQRATKGDEQQIIAKATEECSDAEWNRICDALKVSLCGRVEKR